MKLDSRDIQILVLLQENARIKIADLASRINLSVTPTWQRVKRLEKGGFITGYHARIDLLRLPVKITEIFVAIVLEEHRTQAVRKFEKAIADVPEIVSCFAVAGGYDYIARVLVPDISYYQRLTDRLVDMQISIKQFWTYIVTKDVKIDHTYSSDLLAVAYLEDAK
jgi:Lrp/AsnC family transcriptional regulator of ectoine degradation